MLRLTMPIAGALLVLLMPPPAHAAGPVTVTDGFDGDLGDRWIPLGAEWETVDGALRGRGTGDLVLSEGSWGDVEAEVTVAIPECQSPVYWAGVRLRTDSKKGLGSGYLVYLRRDGKLEIWAGGEIAAIAETPVANRLANGEAVRLGARVTGNRIQGLLDGEVLVTAEDDEIRWGEVALAVCGVTAVFDDFSCRGTSAGGTIYGEVVRHADQMPVEGITVETYHSMDGYPSLALKSTRTDENGRYYLEDLPAGEQAYWVRACGEGLGGGTGWFVTVSDDRPTETHLLVLGKPPATAWVDSASLDPSEPWEEFEDPQAYDGSRAVLRTEISPGEPPRLDCRYDIPQDGSYVLHIAGGLYPELHYWSPFEWRLDEGEWQDAADTLEFENPRYGDRLSLRWARTEPTPLAAGQHVLSLRPSGPAPGTTSTFYWTFDAIAVERLPEPIGPEVADTNAPTLRWMGADDAEVVLQLSMESDFSDGTLTVPHLAGGEWQLPAELRLPDGTYWWRVKPHVPETSSFRGAFGRAAKLQIATGAPAIANVRDRAYDPDRATIRWETDVECESWVEWDLSTLRPRFKSDVSRGREHAVRLTGLQPLTCYRHWIVVRTREGERRSLRRQFLTPRGELSGRQSPFAVFGQGLPYAQQFGEAGVAWMSDYWDWLTLEPEQGKFDWTQAEQRIARAKQAGIDITVTFWGSPAWIRPSHDGEHAWDFTYGPDDLDAAEEFFRELAAHCRGRVDWFLPWIEPNVARDPVFGFPRGYWASRPHAETYAAYERAAYRGAKTGNPDCRVVGMNTAGIALDFIEKSYDEGAADAFDVMNVHYYALTGNFEKQNPEALFGRLRELMARYGDAEKPIICSEGGGASSGLPDTDEASQAANLVRIYVISIANEIDKLCWTFSHDVKPYGSERIDMIMWMGLFRHDSDPDHIAPDLHGEPKPAYFAMRNMTRLLEGSVYRRRLDLGEAIRAYRFDKQTDGGSRRITVIWSEDETREVGLRLTGRLDECVNHLGEPASVQVQGEQAMVSASADPIFITETRE